MNLTENSTEVTPLPPQPTEEQVRKVYVKDLRQGESIHTVFRCQKKERHTTRSGKPYLSVMLCDRTGEVDSRVFENVDAAESVFAVGDYLLVRGKVGTFHGRAQVVIDRLERLDPEPIDPAEFMWTAPPPPPPPPVKAEPERAEREERVRGRERADPDDSAHRAARQRLLRLLDDPHLAVAVDALVRHFEAYIDERLAQRLGSAPKAEKPEKKPKAPRVEHRPHVETKGSERGEIKRDPTLPEGLAFKPLEALVNETPAPKAPEG